MNYDGAQEVEQAVPVYEPTPLMEPATSPSVSIPVEYGSVSPIKFVREEPEVKLARKLAEASAQAQSKKWAIDSAAMPVIQRNIAEGVSHNRQLQQQIEETQRALQQPVPKFEPGKLTMPDIIAAGLASLIGGAQGGNQALQTLQGRQDMLAQQRYKEAGMQWDANRENILLKLRELGADQDTAQRFLDMMKGEEINTLQGMDQAWYAQQLQTLRDQGDLAQEDLRQSAMDRRTQAQIDARKQTTEYKAQLTIIRENLRHAYDLADPKARYEALLDLNQAAALGKIDKSMVDDLARELSGETYTGMVKRSQADLNTERKNELIKTRPARIAKLQADTGVSKKRAELLIKQIENYDAESQARIARSWASVDNFGSMINDRQARREFEQSSQRDEMMKAFAQVTKDGLNALNGQAENLRKQIAELRELKSNTLPDDPEYKEIEGKIRDAEGLLKGAQTNYGALYKTYQEAVGKVGTAQPAPRAGGGTAGGGGNLSEEDLARGAMALAKTPDERKVIYDLWQKKHPGVTFPK